MEGKKFKKYKMYLKMVTSSLLRRRSRMIVALLAIIIGATILSGMITVYYDIPRQMGSEMRSYGANLVLIPSGEGMTADDVNEAKKYFPTSGEVVGIAAYRYSTGKINEQPFMVAGTEFDAVKKVSPFWHVTGSYPSASGEILIGQDVAELLHVLTGDIVTLYGNAGDSSIYSADLRISGIVKTGGTEEGFIYMTLSDLEGLIGGTGKIDAAECSIVATASEIDTAAAEIAARVPAVSAYPVKKVTSSEQAVLSKLTSLVLLVTIVVLILTMICVSTTMMAVVAERRREIGLKKAIGASNRNIIVEFLGENIFLGGLGGAFGILFGFLFAQAVSMNVFSRGITFQPLLIPVTLAASVVITVAACLLPVRNAAEVDPAIVLRGE
ncbi:MAG: ABC transporter permease [Clostridiaceae bacterium]|jgi:putative ABC transport system permease protein|nr:ABC transporter permease [Clostridiaceae bacterium]